MRDEAGTGYRQLIAWQKAIDLVEAVYRLTSSWPREELFGLTSQIRRAAASVPANIAEGRGRTSSKEYAHHLSIAYGSLCEIETYLTIASRLGYIDPTTYETSNERTTEVARVLRGLMKRVQADSSALHETEVDYNPFLTPHASRLTPIARRDNDVARG
jgi:four helix bundle protein